VVISYVLSSYNNEETPSNPILYCPYFVKLVFQEISVGGVWAPDGKLGSLPPCIGLASTLIATTAIFVRRKKK
jgi:hypothetical protein